MWLRGRHVRIPSSPGGTGSRNRKCRREYRPGGKRGRSHKRRWKCRPSPTSRGSPGRRCRRILQVRLRGFETAPHLGFQVPDDVLKGGSGPNRARGVPSLDQGILGTVPELPDRRHHGLPEKELLQDVTFRGAEVRVRVPGSPFRRGKDHEIRCMGVDMYSPVGALSHPGNVRPRA